MRRTVALLLLTASCSGSAVAQDRIVVSAAASLTDAFADMAAAFEAANPDVEVALNLAGSSALREQILAGAPVSVFASANVATMEAVVAAGATSSEPLVFARNRLAIVVPADNPGGVKGLDDFGNESLLIGLCARGVPCGDLAYRVLDLARVTPAIDTNEPDVRAVLTKVAAGELDAALVYVTDVATNADTVGLPVPDDVNVATEYVIAPLTDGAATEAAARFVAFVTSPPGRDILAEHGFALP